MSLEAVASIYFKNRRGLPPSQLQITGLIEDLAEAYATIESIRKLSAASVPLTQEQRESFLTVTLINGAELLSSSPIQEMDYERAG